MQRRTITSSATTSSGRTSSTTTLSLHEGRRNNTSSSGSSSSNIVIRKKRRAPPESFTYRLARLIEEDSMFLILVGCITAVLIVLLVIVGYRIAVTLDLVWGDDPSSWRWRRRGGPRRSWRTTDESEGGHEVIPFAPGVYRVPEAMEIVGDRSTRYAELRKRYDTQKLPLDLERSQRFVQSLPHISISALPIPDALPVAAHHSDQVDTTAVEDGSTMTGSVPYDIYDCPHTPPPGYPYEWNLYHDILKSWPADETDTIPTHIHQGLCVFDFQKDYAKALNYRTHELPFVVVNDPEVARTVERWHQPGYVEQMVGPTIKHRTEYNTNNHFMYAMSPPNIRGKHKMAHVEQDIQDLHGRKAELQNKVAIPQAMRMTYAEWLKHANTTSQHTGPNDEHWYFRLIGCGFMGSDGDCDYGSTEALFDEMPFFQPRPGLYLGEPDEQKGIHCRFGMKGVIAENHFDGSRNAIALLYGRRRYILAHPKNCADLAILPKEHPSARHSAVDYTNPDLQTYPEFANAKSNEVVLEPGQVLYLPTNWFHYIVSLELNYQCNTRSGVSFHYLLHECGF